MSERIMTAAEIAAQAWRPIESAPKNIYVLAYFPDATEQERRRRKAEQAGRYP